MLVSRGVSVRTCLSSWPVYDQWGSRFVTLHCRFCKPLDGALVRRLAREHPVLITIEEGAIGGFASHGAPVLCDAFTLALLYAASPSLIVFSCQL